MSQIPAIPPQPELPPGAALEETPVAPPALPFPVVGIGASAGGLGAFEAFFSGMPAAHDTGMAFVIVQHLSPHHKSMLSELVGRFTRMQVTEVEDGVVLEPNQVYVMPPNRTMVMQGSRLKLVAPTAPRTQRLPIDTFLASLAAGQKECAIGIVLSGTGSDGTLGLRAIKAEGGMAMAQDPATAEHAGMPRSAVRTGLIDFVVAPQEMPRQMVAYTRHAFSTPVATVEPDEEGSALRAVTGLLRSVTGHDFSHYKTTTLMRRTARRMALRQVGSLMAYSAYAADHVEEVDALFQDLLIGVTSFFRDPQAYQLLESRVIPALLARKGSGEVVRVWSCGCSTGEEAYTLAILFHEAIEAAGHSIRVQVFATDLDRQAINTARRGVFPSSVAADLAPERLARHFTYDHASDTYQVRRNLRDMLVLSEHNVLRDPPFSRIDLLVCRNLLIYFNAEAQRSVLPLFHYALSPGGYLMLGTSETLGAYTNLFTPADRKWKVYAREAVDSAAYRKGFPSFALPTRSARMTHRPGREGLPREGPSLRQLTERSLLAHSADAALLVNGRGEILYLMGRTGRYLEQPSGHPSLNVFALAGKGVRHELTVGLQRAITERRSSVFRGLPVRVDGAAAWADLAIRPIAHGEDPNTADLYLIVLQEAAPDADAPAVAPTPGDGTVARLEQELVAKEDFLQAMLEEMETTNEELKVTNEEVQSVNEELQSTNEELETSKEELQSVNEELSTVNAELQDRVAELSRSSNDMNNLLAGTGIATIFVDQSLKIARFTPAATQIINLIPADVGRPVEHLAPNLVGYDALVTDLAEVLATLTPREAEVRSKSGTWYLMRMRPYRTADDAVEGAVLTFVDISERRRAEFALTESIERFQSIFNCVPAGLAQFDVTGRYLFVNDTQCQVLGRSRRELLALHVHDLLPPDEAATLRARLRELREGAPPFRFRHRQIRRDGTEQWRDSWISPVRDHTGEVTTAVSVSVEASGLADDPQQEGAP